MSDIKRKKALRATSNSLNSNPPGTYTLDGRVYNSEKYAGPLTPRKDHIAHLRYNEQVSATDIHNIERMLQGFVGRVYSNKMKKEVREAIIKKYNLRQEGISKRWVGDTEEIFNKICEEYPQAVKYKKYSGLLYAMKYGDTPCTVYRRSEKSE